MEDSDFDLVLNVNLKVRNILGILNQGENSLTVNGFAKNFPQFLEFFTKNNGKCQKMPENSKKSQKIFDKNFFAKLFPP
jgi:hypothetical protein